MKDLIALICRHGETKLNADNRFRSWLDVHLDKKGEQQAEDMANVLTTFPIKSVFSSPLYRTVFTANTYANKVDIQVQQNRGLFPWNLGVLAGTDKTDNKGLLQQMVDNPSLKIPNGESLEDFENRGAQFFTEVLFRNTETLKAVFCHTSNIILLEGFLKGERNGPETAEIVKPGGICALYKTDNWYVIEPIFRKADEAEI